MMSQRVALVLLGLAAAGAPLAAQGHGHGQGRGHYKSSPDHALTVTREVLVRQGYEVIRIENAGTDQVVVRAATRPDGVSVTIRDHGKGFALDSSPAGFGLTRSVVDRMQEVGGTAEVWSEPGRGTRVTLWVPQ